jgi:hypothetical protein
MARRGPARESGHGQVERPPKEVHRAAFSQEAGAERREDPISLNKHSPAAGGPIAVVGGVLFVFVEWGRVLKLVWLGVDAHLDAEFAEPLP